MSHTELGSYESFEHFLSDAEEWESLESLARMCWTFAHEKAALEDELAATQQQRDELLALVEQVEFIQDRGPRNRDYDVCPSCDSWMRDGHAPDCLRQAAIAKVRGEEAR